MKISNIFNKLYGFSIPGLCHGRGCPSCVAVKQEGADILVADTKNPDQAPLVFNADEWKAFIASVKNNEFDYQDVE